MCCSLHKETPTPKKNGRESIFTWYFIPSLNNCYKVHLDHICIYLLQYYHFLPNLDQDILVPGAACQIHPTGRGVGQVGGVNLCFMPRRGRDLCNQSVAGLRGLMPQLLGMGGTQCSLPPHMHAGARALPGLPSSFPAFQAALDPPMVQGNSHQVFSEHQKSWAGRGHCLCSKTTELCCIPGCATHFSCDGENQAALCCWKQCLPHEGKGASYRRQLWGHDDITAISSGTGVAN